MGSFLPSNQQEQKLKKQKTELLPGTAAPAIAIAAAMPASNAEKEDGMNVHGHQNSGALRPNLGSSPFQRENWPPMNSMQDSRNSATDINISLPGG